MLYDFNMARRVFFSFYYERDVWRASQIRNSWVTKPDRQAAGFFDKAEWEEVKRKTDPEIKKWINKQLDGTSCTVVLIGAETSDRKWVRYEIEESLRRGNGVIGVKIHNLKDQNGEIDSEGSTDFGLIDGKHTFEELFSIYDWKEDDGYENFADWLETCALIAGRPELLPPKYRSIDPQNCVRE